MVHRGKNLPDVVNHVLHVQQVLPFLIHLLVDLAFALVPVLVVGLSLALILVLVPYPDHDPELPVPCFLDPYYWVSSYQVSLYFDPFQQPVWTLFPVRDHLLSSSARVLSFHFPSRDSCPSYRDQLPDLDQDDRSRVYSQVHPSTIQNLHRHHLWIFSPLQVVVEEVVASS